MGSFLLPCFFGGFMSIAIKLIAIAASVYGQIRQFNGLDSYTYFTNLSNVFADIVLLISLIYDLRKAEKPQIFYKIKFAATVSITLTFLIFMFILAPLYHPYISAYSHAGYASFGVHFALPLLTIIDFFIYDKKYISKKHDALFGILPALIYVVFVVVLAEVFSYRWNLVMKAPYNFLNYNSKSGWFGYVPNAFSVESTGIGVAYMIIILTIIFFAISKLYLFLHKKLQK